MIFGFRIFLLDIKRFDRILTGALPITGISHVGQARRGTMFLRIFTLVAFAASLFLSTPASAQTPAKAEDQYLVLTYLQVAPEHTAAYDEILRTTAKTFYTEMMNRPGQNAWAWSVAKMLFSGIHGNQATHVAAIVFSGPPPSGSLDLKLADEILKKVANMEPAEYRKKLAGMRKELGTELWRGVAWTPAGSAEGSYRVVAYSKVAPRKAADYREVSSRVWRPLYAAAAEQGNLIGWSTWSSVFPRGEGTPYNALTATTFKDLPSAVRGFTPSASDFHKVHPNASFISAVDQIRDLRPLGTVVVSEIIAASQKSVTRQ
jgi:hypothetical protein